MWEFIRILFLSNSIWLTSGVIDLDAGATRVFSDTELSAVNSGANIMIDLTDMMPPEARDNIQSSRAWVTANIPVGSIGAKLKCPDCEGNVELSFRGQTSWDDDSMGIRLESGGYMPKGKEFTEVRIFSKVKLSRVRVQWQNYGK